jgi:hypothetical protein
MNSEHDRLVAALSAADAALTTLQTAAWAD